MGFFADVRLVIWHRQSICCTCICVYMHTNTQHMCTTVGEVGNPMTHAWVCICMNAYLLD
jgi:hypothetical protein